MREIISFDDLRELSGFRSLNRIKRWLTESGIPFLTDRYGRPRVNQYALRHAMGGGKATEDLPQSNQEPEWDNIK